jgi:hypothetical protein
MLHGFSGHLVAESFLAGQPAIDDTADACRRRLDTSRAAWLGRIGPASAPRAILEAALVPLVGALGYGPPARVERAGDALVAVVAAGGCTVTVLAVPWGDRLDGYWRSAVAEAHRHATLWCLLFNGVTLRIVDARRLYSRRVADFDVALALDRADGFSALWRLAGPHALCTEPADPRSLHALVAASDRHAAGVCRSLRDGVLTASADVLGALVARRPPEETASIANGFEQALTIVYRILFLLFAEARSLVPLWHHVYRTSYSIESLREIAERPGASAGLWDALRAIARLAHAGCRAGDLRVTPFNGRLFSPARTPLAERRDLDDEAARRAVLALSTRAAADRAGRERIAYRDLGVEQLGAVYETLLDYQPRIEHAPAVGRRRRAPIVTLETGSGARKATGTFYTPEAIAHHLVRRTLAPLVRDRPADAILDLRIVDPAMGSGAFLVAACRYLASAYEQALVDGGTCHPRDLGEPDRVAIRRLVAERCLYGVDLNPMAVQLARLSLWLATLAADRPLSFLDHRLLTGDSLLGAWLTTLRQPPSRRRRTLSPALPLFGDDLAVDALRAAVPLRFSLESPSDTLEDVRAKERALTALTRSGVGLSQWKRVADLWCAAWFGRSSAPAARAAFGSLADAILTGRSALPAHTVAARLADADAIAGAKRFFHWELEFPEVFFDGDGVRRARPGFDAVVGNPPWDMIRADAGDSGMRHRLRQDADGLLRFTRDAGVYAAQSSGQANRYQLFVERAVALLREGGRLGLVLPSGFAADHGSAALRRLLFTRCDVDALVGIDNQRGIFPIHRSVRFVLVTATAGSATRSIGCRFGIQSTGELDALGDEAADRSAFPIALSVGALERLSGPSLAIPHVRSTVDLAICEKASSLFAPLESAAGWNARFGRELNATDDRGAFRPPGRGLPVVDGKHLEPFRVAVERAGRSITVTDAARLVGRAHVYRPRLAYRDVASATNRVTLIAAILPRGCASTHTVFCLRTPRPLRDQLFLCGLFNSLVVNFLVRLRVTTHVTTGIVERLPIPTTDVAPAACREIATLARQLQRSPDVEALATLNARVAELYQLTSAELAHILDTFPLVNREERDLVLERAALRG